MISGRRKTAGDHEKTGHITNYTSQVLRRAGDHWQPIKTYRFGHGNLGGVAARIRGGGRDVLIGDVASGQVNVNGGHASDPGDDIGGAQKSLGVGRIGAGIELNPVGIVRVIGQHTCDQGDSRVVGHSRQCRRHGVGVAAVEQADVAGISGIGEKGVAQDGTLPAVDDHAQLIVKGDRVAGTRCQSTDQVVVGSGQIYARQIVLQV